jgi:hypothetical protein
MTNTIDFRGLTIDNIVTWTAGEPDDVRIYRHETTGNKTEFKIFNSIPNGYTSPKQIAVPYIKTTYDANGEVLGVENMPKYVNTDFYDLFAEMQLTGKQFDLQRRPELNAILQVLTGKQFDLQRRPELNAILQVVCKDERAIAFDPTNNYEPIQPIIFDVAVNDLELTVTNVSIDGGKTPEYSLDGVTYQDSNILTAGGYGESTVYVRYKTELYAFKLVVNLVDPNGE